MPCGCSKRAEKFLYHILGFRRGSTGKIKLPAWIYETKDVALHIRPMSVWKYHFRVTLLAIVVRILFGRNAVEKPPVIINIGRFSEVDNEAFSKWADPKGFAFVNRQKDGPTLVIYSLDGITWEDRKTEHIPFGDVPWGKNIEGE